MDIVVLHNAATYLVCHKPAGVEAEHQLPRLVCEQENLPCLYPVHRLDKETAGVILLAKTKPAAAFFSQAVAQNKLEKTYLAVVKGTPPEPAGTFTDLLFRDKQKNKSYPVKRMRKGVKEARLSYQTVEGLTLNGVPHTLVKIALQTGRTHQIRVQFASRQMPLLGDKKYGGCPHPTLGLLAYRLTFPTPQGEWVTVTAPQTSPL